MSTKRPWMPMFWGDYLADTGHLSTVEHGAYLLLIAHYWTNGGLPNDEAVLRRITRMTPRQWLQSRDVLRSLFENEWRHKRIDIELGKAIEKSKVNSANASKSHQSRKANASNPQTHSDSQSDTEEEKIKRADARDDDVARETELDPEPVNEEPKAKLFRIGKTILASFGITEKRMGPLIGQWLKTCGDPVGLLAAIQYARDQNVAEPVAYISAVLNGKGKTNGTGRTQSLGDRARELAEQARKLERAAGIGREDDLVGGA